MTPIGGGVDIQPVKAIEKKNWLPDTDGEVLEARKKVDLSQLPEGQWWWD